MIFEGNKKNMTSIGSPLYPHRNKTQLQELNTHIKAYTNMAGKHATFIIKPDPITPSQYIVDFLNILHAHNVSQVTFATMP